jgi:hypothetical protein
VSPRVLALLVMALSFWILTGLRRAQISTPYESRYLYVGGLFVLLLAVELMRGVSPSRRAFALVACAVGAAVLANLGDLRDGGRSLRAQAPPTRAALGVLELARPLVETDYVVAGFPSYPLVVIEAGPYFEAADALGSPAASEAEIAALPEDARLVADAELARIHRVALRPGASGAPMGGRPAVDAVTGGTVSEQGGCMTFRPAVAQPAGVEKEVQLTLPPAGLLLTAEDGPAAVSVRRFAVGFPQEPQAALSASGSATLRIGPDRATRPWHVRVEPAADVRACGLR